MRKTLALVAIASLLAAPAFAQPAAGGAAPKDA